MSNQSSRYAGRFLESGERPRYTYTYWVTGTGDFPYDMLRYDAAWPSAPDDAQKLGWSYADPNAPRDQHRRSVMLRSNSEPTIDRWASFTWSVSRDRP